MQATEILTICGQKNRTQAGLRPPQLKSGWLLKGRSLTILTSLRSERPELLLRTRPTGDWGKGGGAALTTLTSLRSERSGTATETDQGKRRPGNEKRAPKQEDDKGGESSADNPDQSAVREARHHKGRVR